MVVSLSYFVVVLHNSVSGVLMKLSTSCDGFGGASYHTACMFWSLDIMTK